MTGFQTDLLPKEAGSPTTGNETHAGLETIVSAIQLTLTVAVAQTKPAGVNRRV
jgi:hypothetical protein